MINLHAHVYFCCSIQILVLSFVTSVDVSVLSSKRHFAVTVSLPVSFLLVILNIYLISMYTNSTLGEQKFKTFYSLILQTQILSKLIFISIHYLYAVSWLFILTIWLVLGRYATLYFVTCLWTNPAYGCYME